MSKYKEIFKLKEMLEKENIKFEFKDKTVRKENIKNLLDIEEKYPEIFEINKRMFNGLYEIMVYKNKKIFQRKWKELVCVREGWNTWGEEKDLLEIIGLTKNGYLSEGYLTAEEVFKRIKENL